MDTTTINKQAYLAFKLGDEIFAVSVTKVIEVLEIQKITKVPTAPSFLRGIINIRGNILPVINTRTKFNMELIEDTKKTVIIVFDLLIHNKQVIVGALADSVKEVFELHDSEIKPIPEMGTQYNINFIIGVYKKNSDFIQILDVDKVFSITEVDLMAKIHEPILQ